MKFKYKSRYGYICFYSGIFIGLAIFFDRNRDKNTGVSWYVEKHCIDVSQLQPISLMFIGVVMQTLISGFLLRRETSQNSSNWNDPKVPLVSVQHIDDIEAGNVVHNNTDLQQQEILKEQGQQQEVLKEQEEETNNSTVTSVNKCTISECAKWSEYLLLRWQCVSIIAVFALDLKKIWVALSYLNTHDDFGTQFDYPQCFATILLTSSNAKTLFTYSLFIILQQQCIHYDPRILYQHFQQTFPQSSRTKNAFVTASALLGCLQFTCIFYATVPMVVYLWIPAIIVLPCVLCGYYCTRRENEEMREWMEGNEGKEDQKRFLTMSCASLMVMCILVGGLAIVNLFQGRGYWNSLLLVLSERRWKDYLHHLEDNVEGGFRFITWIL